MRDVVATVMTSTKTDNSPAIRSHSPPRHGNNLERGGEREGERERRGERERGRSIQ